MLRSLSYTFLQLLVKLTPHRAWNVVKVVVSYFLSRLSGKVIHWGWPVSVAIEPTTACNLRCPECPSGLRSFTRATGTLQEDFYSSLIRQLGDHILYLTFYFQGEPFLHPRFTEMVQQAHARKIFTATSTNAHFLDDARAKATVESGLDRLIISIDGTTQQTYEQYRIGGDLKKVIEGTKNVVRWKKQLHSRSPQLIFQFLVVKHNEHEMEEVRRLQKELGVDELWIKTAQVYDFKHGNSLIPENESYSRYKKKEDGSWKIKNPLNNHCWKMWHSCVVTWDGQVVPCCFDKDAKHALGSLTQSSFAEIWKGSSYHQFRASLLRSRKEIDICANCSEGGLIFK